MNKQFLEALTSACKDFALSDKAIAQLAELGGEGIGDNPSQEDIDKAVARLTPFAKAMQGEVTRKTAPKPKQSPTEGDGEGDKPTATPSAAEAILQQLAQRLEALENESKAYREQSTRAQRTERIAAKAKELQIPDFIMKRVAISDDADYEAELTTLKQDLVAANLAPKEQTETVATTEEQMRADAEAFAATLPGD